MKVLSHSLTPLALRAIKFYQKKISPKKGYNCAYSKLYGGSGCSGVGHRLIRRYGLLNGLITLRKRFDRCHMAYKKLCLQHHTNSGIPKYQQGSAIFFSNKTIYVIEEASECDILDNNPAAVCAIGGAGYIFSCCGSRW